uniref:Glycosyltransferase n=1 Tax=Roseihalotalea indica TaxID=2867963 RepID=A0AA49GLB1_9BACT|nr:glycosyltransferase [Tunicatimonas sp. TK19036]
MIKTLYLSYDGMTDPLGQSQVIPYLQGLAKQDYQFTIISFEKAERFKEAKSQIQTLLDACNIGWVPLPYHKKPPVLSTLYDVYQLRRKAYQLHRQHNFRIIHCRSYISALIGMAMKRKFGTKFIFDMRGFWADERVEGGLWNLKNPLFRVIYHYFKRKEIELLSEADYTVTLTHKAKDIIHKWTEVKNQPIPIQVIPCCVDTALFDPEKIDALAKKLLKKKFAIPQDAFVLSYLGSLGTWYMVEEMLIFYRKLQQTYSNAYFLFITKDSPEEIWQLCEKNNIDTDKIVITAATRQEVPLYLSLSNWSIFFIKPVFSKQASSATKMGEIMSMGIPMIVNSGIGDTDNIIQSINCGFLISNVKSFEYQVVLHKIHKSIEFSSALIRKGACELFSLSKGIGSYSKVYKKFY